MGYQASFKILRCLKMTRSKVASKKLGMCVYIYVYMCSSRCGKSNQALSFAEK